MLCNADEDGVCQIFVNKMLQRCKVQRYERVGGVQFPEKKRYVTLEWPPVNYNKMKASTVTVTGCPGYYDI